MALPQQWKLSKVLSSRIKRIVGVRLVSDAHNFHRDVQQSREPTRRQSRMALRMSSSLLIGSAGSCHQSHHCTVLRSRE